jgi:NTP pyrophosphatase (non-canonical NTP hydrolase)
MRFSDYQKKAHHTAIYPRIIVLRKDGTKKDITWIYPLLGYIGEIGELSNKFKKVIRDHNFVITKQMRSDLEDELGDVDWYKAELYGKLKLNDDKIKRKNLIKLRSRKMRKKLKGKGDNR